MAIVRDPYSRRLLRAIRAAAAWGTVALSLALALALAVDWRQSHRRWWGLTIDTGTEIKPRIGSQSGYMTFSIRQYVPVPRRFQLVVGTYFNPANVIDGLGYWGFGFARNKPGDTWFRKVKAPHWFLILVVLIPDALLLRRVLRLHRRRRLGLCLRCGYDLRATPARCPECGTEPPSQSPEQTSPGHAPSS